MDPQTDMKTLVKLNVSIPLAYLWSRAGETSADHDLP